MIPNAYNDGFNGSQQLLSLDPKHTQMQKIYREYLPRSDFPLNKFQSAKQITLYFFLKFVNKIERKSKLKKNSQK